MKLFLSLFLPAIFLFMLACNNDSDNNDTQSSVARLSYSIAGSYPHDTSSYTQGLAFYKGQVFEGTGSYGRSRLMQIDLKTGKAIKQEVLDPKLFGEGITILNDTIYQLTWKEKIVLVYSVKDLKKIKEVPLDIEGWGLTNDGK
ncbi:MAG: glutaminyl-peptide cyclotransferase, partial [Chitinophagaceae bacterium]|nr:glutaminyl-peptide cyclotransferase [Chitinophagaceae bacterium]